MANVELFFGMSGIGLPLVKRMPSWVFITGYYSVLMNFDFKFQCVTFLEFSAKLLQIDQFGLTI